jgi:hypothetical protein
MIDHWASSAEESQDESRIQQIRRRMKGKVAPPSCQSSDSIRSPRSTEPHNFHRSFPSSGNTVIYNAVKNKAEYFEQIKVEERDVSIAVGEVDRPSKPIVEIRKSFENIKGPVGMREAGQEDVIRPNLVKEMRKSFENMPFPDPPTAQVIIPA